MKRTTNILMLLAFSLLSQGIFAQKDYKQQVETLTKKIQNDPDNLSLYYSRADAYDVLNDFAGANKDYAKVLELYYKTPNDKYKGEFSKACYKLADDYFYRKGNKEKALTLAQEGLRVYPNLKSLEILEAEILSASKEKRDEAKEKYEALVEKYPGDEKLLLNYAKLLEETDLEAAAKYYEKALAINPDNVDVLFDLGILYANRANELLSSGKYAVGTKSLEKGVTHLEHYLDLKPGDQEVTQILIEYYQFLGRTEDADKLKSKL